MTQTKSSGEAETSPAGTGAREAPSQAAAKGKPFPTPGKVTQGTSQPATAPVKRRQFPVPTD